MKGDTVERYQDIYTRLVSLRLRQDLAMVKVPTTPDECIAQAEHISNALLLVQRLKDGDVVPNPILLVLCNALRNPGDVADFLKQTSRVSPGLKSTT